MAVDKRSEVSFSIPQQHCRADQGSVATRLRYGGIFKYEFVANLPLSPPAKEFQKSVNIRENYGHGVYVL